ncbi:hypothetical protein, partial [Streptomyces prunicolor]|uniref:hypothetical protein n=1 Tax=Streptomyces prunicolor TaxID=67348 RepID=UPI0033C8515A
MVSPAPLTPVDTWRAQPFSAAAPTPAPVAERARNRRRLRGAPARGGVVGHALLRGELLEPGSADER